ncbi:hypothetical protein [Methylobacterium sp. PvR107]|uniref:hypothetical protein n=1 Tax=Methylobacterium sp. PvR107 TaxID=2806597 RepID=UPI001B725000|nr:hypothetical protein [Methylobacterium sp. PvR107]MBP1179423.1 transcriptional regulator GlxA family with amidase domain [Methylobacterium sp. PvR107]
MGKRGGGQMQFSRRGVSAPFGRSALLDAQRWAAAHPAEDLRVERLASRTGMSPAISRECSAPRPV